MTFGAEKVNGSVGGPEAELRKSVLQSLLAGEVFLGKNGRDGHPEDLAIEILQSENTTEKAIVIGVCEEIFGFLLQELVKTRPDPNQKLSGNSSTVAQVVATLCILINRTAPIELAHHIQSLLTLVARPDVPKVIQGPVARAALVYARTEADAPFWESLTSNKTIGLWALKALTKIDVRHPRIITALARVWQQVLNGELKTNIDAIVDDLAAKQTAPARFHVRLHEALKSLIGTNEYNEHFSVMTVSSPQKRSAYSYKQHSESAQTTSASSIYVKAPDFLENKQGRSLFLPVSTRPGEKLPIAGLSRSRINRYLRTRKLRDSQKRLLSESSSARGHSHSSAKVELQDPIHKDAVVVRGLRKRIKARAIPDGLFHIQHNETLAPLRASHSTGVELDLGAYIKKTPCRI